MASEKVAKLGIKREHSHLYYVTGDGHVARKLKSGGEPEILHQNAVKPEKTHLYFLDKDGDVARSPRATRSS